jgi:SAM-dependent methyltransferase
MASDSDPTASANAAQAEYWNSAPAQTWINCQAALDQRFAPLTQLLIGRAGVRTGECVIDVGCGTGATTIQLAAAVGAHGSVLAVDISEPLIAVARRRCLEGGHANVRLICGDAQTHRFERGCHDLVVSRFGVMFFDDPVGAFRNLAGALRPRGRLAFVCWPPLEANPWLALPLEVGVARLGPPEPQPPRAPGPLALSEPDYIDQILSAAGFADVRIERTETWLPGAPSARQEAELAGQVGLLARLLRERAADEATRAELIGELTRRFAPYLTEHGVRLPAVIHLVTATAPG